MIIKKKGKEVHEETAQKKKKGKNSGSQTIIKIEKDVQTVIKTKDDDWFETKAKTKGRKKKSLEEDECLDQLKSKKKKNKKKKVCSEFQEEARSESFVNVESHLDLEPQEESEEPIKIIKKKKKKDHRHSFLSLENNQRSEVGLSNHHTDGTQENEFLFKKSRKNIALNLEWDGEVTKEKKTSIFSLALEDYHDSEQKQSKKELKKKHKNTSQEKDVTGTNHGTDIIQNDGESYVRRKKKKKKKDKPASFLPLTCSQDNVCGVYDSHIAINDFRKRKRKNSQEFTLLNKEEEDNIENSESFRETTKKKKKKSQDVSSLICEDNQDYRHRVPDESLSAQQEVESEEKELSGKKHRKNIKDNNDVTKKKKKKKIQKEEEETTDSLFAISEDRTSKSKKITLPESNEKNNESETKLAECVTGDVVDRVLCNYNHLLSDKKTKKRKKVQRDSTEEPGSKANLKKKKVKRENTGNEALEHVDDVTIVQEKKGNCDEINIDKVRRQALQEEIDRESGKTKVFSTKVEPDAKFGQWSTAAFQSPDRGMKFLRLMGGFKKGSMSIQDLSATTNKPNMALSREGEEKLQQALKMEFDKAMDLKQHRRIGLGFQPAATKKVYIDKYTSRSIKFED
nr:PREDICTED: lysine-rich nucleolar protein 1 [Struthio camelus australis]XP_009681722.1 PREDICTED: lysine-rich nucleolar protein 1 [Struthio camelus australis]